MIYDLNDLTGDLSPLMLDVRVLFRRQKGAGGDVLEFGTWLDAGDPADLPDCFSVPYPQFVPTCYRAERFGFNPSGTRLYFERNLPGDFTSEPGQWHGVQRIHIDKTDGPDLADWTLSEPELVYTAGPSGVRPRPDNDALVLPLPEYIAVDLGNGPDINEVVSILDADQCSSDFAPYAGGNLDGPPDLWKGCVDNSTFYTGTLPGRPDSWQSHEALLKTSYQDPGHDIHRVYVTGAVAGTEQLVIENARFPDSGF
jgi:hypothetical protein